MQRSNSKNLSRVMLERFYIARWFPRDPIFELYKVIAVFEDSYTKLHIIQLEIVGTTENRTVIGRRFNQLLQVFLERTDITPATLVELVKLRLNGLLSADAYNKFVRVINGNKTKNSA